MEYKILEYDNILKNYYEQDINLRAESYKAKRRELVKRGTTLSDFANGADYFGIHRTETGWVYREWAPAADAMYFRGDFNNWEKMTHPLKRLENGIFEIEMEGADALWSGCKVQAIVVNGDRVLERVPLYATRVVQDPETNLWNAEVYESETPFKWTDSDFKGEKTPLIYECHIGMAQEKYGIGTYTEFKENTLPRIKELGYNTIQIMAIMEHPYYGSFGYQVSNFFAASSRFGTPDELKDMINTAHEMGIRVLLDVVHSHAVKNTNEGINQFDGTEYQFFHAGEKGNHSAWDTKLFNYGKNEVIHFLLSNLKFWMTEYHFDGFRFDGVTSMLYLDHGLGSAFDNYNKYFSMNTDIEALTYLTLATELIHQVNKDALALAEDMSGMPGMCIPIRQGGVGFDYRLAMGGPDFWIKTLKCNDEDWDIWKLWYELTGRRPKEKVIGYVESHDQALVGDKTVMFRLCDKEMYWCMAKNTQSMIIDRGIALHKMIRLVTMSLSGEGYLNFMGNEFGHPEWIDFPREGNGWSYHYCRRQWGLVDNHDLKYEWLNDFDKAMIGLAKKEKLLGEKEEAHNLWVHQGDKVLMYEKGKDIFAFNFHSNRSFSGYFVPVSEPGEYKAILTTDAPEFGGFDRVSLDTVYNTIELPDGRCGFLVYIPSRTAIVFKKSAKKRAARNKED